MARTRKKLTRAHVVALEALKRDAGLQREEFFSKPGADLAQWRGTGNTHKDKRREANRKACRSRVKE